MADAGESWRSEGEGAAKLRPPEIPLDPMEFLSRSWSVPALHVSRAIEPPAPPAATAATGSIAEDDIIGEHEEEIAPTPASVAGNSFSFASAATSQLVLERIMSQSQEVSPLTSGRLSHSSGPLNGGDYLTDSPPVSPSDLDDVKYVRAISGAAKPPQLRQAGGGSGRTVGRWLKDRRERKKEEARAHNAQVHAAVSVAGVAAAVAAVAAATAAASGSTGRDERAARTDMAVASAATLVAAQCVEAAEAMGAEREHLAAVVGSAVSVRTPGDIVTLTAAAATALRGAATLRARALREVWNIAAVIPVEKGGLGPQFDNRCRNPQLQKSPAAAAGNDGSGARLSDEFMQQENFLGICSQELLARGAELLKRTRAGALHWKMVSVYINKTGQVTLKMKSRHIAGTITKKKKSVVVEVCREVAAWPGRYLLEGGERRHYFGLKTAEGRVIEFECRTQREHDLWTQGVAGLLDISGKGTHRNSLNI